MSRFGKSSPTKCISFCRRDEKTWPEVPFSMCYRRKGTRMVVSWLNYKELGR